MGRFAKPRSIGYDGSATTRAAPIEKATPVTASSYARSDLCSASSCHLLKHAVHKPVSKGWPKGVTHAQNTFAALLILGVSELSKLVFRTSQQLYYFIW